MYINFKSKIFTNNVKPNIQDEKVATLPSNNLEAQFNKFYFNKKNNSRNYNFISLRKTPKNKNIFIQTFSNNKYSTKSEEPKLLISSDIKPKNDKKISNFDKNENNSHLNTVGNSYERPFNKNSNILLTDSNINKNDYSQKKKLNHTNIIEFKKRRFSVMEMPNNILDIRKALFNSNNNNNRRSSIIQSRNNNTSKFSKRHSMHFISNPILRGKITELIKDLQLNHKTEIKLYEKGQGDIINKKSKEKIDETKGGHAVVLIEIEENCLKFLNSCY